MNHYIPNGIIPIKWFGDRKAYGNSDVKVVTVGLNPSDKEFRERDGQPFSTELRFPRYKADKPRSLTSALNDYFKTNPYRWFNAFETLLNGMGASYYNKEEYHYRALHTDICSSWATDPTWTKLPKQEREKIYNNQDYGHPFWNKLIAKLKPDIIIASVARNYIVDLGIEDTEKLFCRFDLKKDGTPRKNPVTVFRYDYCGIPFINCSLLCSPYTGLSKESQIEIGKKIKKRLLRRWK